jgi:hypothetical protein
MSFCAWARQLRIQKSGRAVYTVAQYLIARDVVNVFLQAPHRILIFRDDVRGLRLTPLYVLPLGEVEKD